MAWGCWYSLKEMISWKLISYYWKKKINVEAPTLPICKIAADGDYSHEIKRGLLLERKAMTNLDSIIKSKDITLLTKVYIVKAMVFPVVMYGGELDYKKKLSTEELML